MVAPEKETKPIKSQVFIFRTESNKYYVEAEGYIQAVEIFQKNKPDLLKYIVSVTIDNQCEVVK